MSITPLVIIPARAGSRGVPNKNFARLPDGTTLTGRAMKIGQQIGQTVISSDIAPWCVPVADEPLGCAWLQRPAALATDDTPMSAVVQHVLASVPGPPDQPIVLLQPTVPFRTVAQVQRVLAAWHAQDLGCYATIRAIPQMYWRARPLWDTDPLIPREQAKPLYQFSGTAYVWPRRYSFPESWVPVIEDSQPYLNIDEPADWQQLVTLLSVQPVA